VALAPPVSASPSTKLQRHQSLYGALLVWVVVATLVLRFCWVVSRYSVNLFFFDEWDVYAGLFRGWPWWRFFLQEHGPHRQGLGVTAVVWLLRATHWDSRVQAYAIAAAIILAALTAIRLKTSLFAPLQFSDVIIPVAFLGLGQWEVLLSAPGPSAQAFPLLLLMLYCFFWAQEKTWLRYTGAVLLNLLLIYTGYGIFGSVITFSLLAIDSWQKRRTRAELIPPLTALVASSLSLASFFYRYVFNPAADCFQFPYPNLAAYPWFMAMMLARFVGIKHGRVLPGGIGLVALVVLIAVCVRSLWIVLQRMDRAAVIVLILTGYTLIYAAAAAIGRVCMGMEAAQSSRNITLLIPGFAGTYFYLLSMNRNRIAKIPIAVLLLALLPACIQRNHKEIEGFAAMKTAWKNCYFANENIAYCDAATHLQLYPNPDAIRLSKKLTYLKENHLNLYKNSN
jgi:hypothetical protein